MAAMMKQLLLLLSLLVLIITPLATALALPDLDEGQSPSSINSIGDLNGLLVPDSSKGVASAQNAYHCKENSGDSHDTVPVLVAMEAYNKLKDDDSIVRLLRGPERCVTLYCSDMTQVLQCNENEDKKFAFKKRDLARVLKFIIDNCAKDNNVKGQYNFDDGWNVQLVGVPPNICGPHKPPVMIRDLEVRDGETGLSARNSYWCDTGDVGDWAKKVIAMDAYHMLQASPTLYNINKGHATGNANCGNLYCTQYAQIVWCNDNQEHGFMAHGYELAPYVKQIIDACTYEDTVRGQLWGDGGWNLKIVGDKGLTCHAPWVKSRGEDCSEYFPSSDAYEYCCENGGDNCWNDDRKLLTSREENSGDYFPGSDAYEYCCEQSGWTSPGC